MLYSETEKPFKKYSLGEMFGDSDVILGLEWDGTAVATMNTILLVVNKDDIDKLFISNQ